MKIGYARVSTADQNLELQTDALNEAGCKKIFSDRGVSGAKAERPGLDKALEHIRKKDVLVIGVSVSSEQKTTLSTSNFCTN